MWQKINSDSGCAKPARKSGGRQLQIENGQSKTTIGRSEMMQCIESLCNVITCHFFLHCIFHFIDVLYWNTRHHTNILLPKFFASRFRIFYCPSFLARARSFMCILYKSGDKSFLARRQVTAWNPFSRASRASVKNFANKNIKFLLKK